MCQQRSLDKGTMDFMSYQTITRQTNAYVGAQIVKVMECTLFQGICIPDKDGLLQPCKQRGMAL